MDEYKIFGSLSGQLLVAMPQMRDPRFARTVIYMVAHTEDGAMGLVLNRVLGSVTFPDLLRQLGIDASDSASNIHVHFGGPVETGRGFVLHSADYHQGATLRVDEKVSLTATIDILRDIADGAGPRHCLLALGYAGWGPGQLEDELHGNGWLHVTADEDLVFGEDLEGKWEHAIAKIGVDFRNLSDEVGHA
ncbi:MAG: YqgE/AlgH family protein [Alphaproteobacteria bacterium]